MGLALIRKEITFSGKNKQGKNKRNEEKRVYTMGREHSIAVAPSFVSSNLQDPL